MANIIAKIGGTVVSEVSNGIDAVSEFARTGPDLVLLDITMPRLDGIDTLGRIMEKDKQAKVVIVSSLGNKDMVWKAMMLGARTFLTKPYNPDYASLIIGDLMSEQTAAQGGAR
jgi:two-component system chemotaxis response regulator CheY